MTSKELQAKARPIALGVVAFALIGTLVVKNLPSGAPDASSPSARPKGTDVAQVPSVLATHDRPALEARYKAIVEADPFRERKFTKKGPGGGPGGSGTGGFDGDRRDGGSGGKSDSGPSSLALRLTALVFGDDGFQAFFEDRSAGKGMFLKQNEALDKERTVATIGTDSVTFTQKGQTSSLHLGDKLDVGIADVSSRLLTVGVGVVSSGTSSTTSAPATTATPALSEDKRNEVLERLKAKRKASMGGDKKEDEKK